MQASSALIVRVDPLPPEPDADEDPGPKLFGVILTAWLAHVLSVRGRVVERRLPDNLGQPVLIRAQNCHLRIAVSNADDVGAEWRVSCSGEPIPSTRSDCGAAD